MLHTPTIGGFILFIVGTLIQPGADEQNLAADQGKNPFYPAFNPKLSVYLLAVAFNCGNAKAKLCCYFPAAQPGK